MLKQKRKGKRMNIKYGFDKVSQMNAINFLKGIIVSYSKKNGMKHSSKKQETEYYQKGKLLFESKYYFDAKCITVVHIIYNRLRHEKAHKDSFSSDQSYINMGYYFPSDILKEILGENYIKLTEDI